MKRNRLRSMEEYVMERGFVSMEELCSAFGVSINTVRNDVREIISRGHVRKTYGGVTYEKPEGVFGTEMQENEHADAERAIAREAARRVENGDIVYLDVGTTCMYVVDYIPQDCSVTIITNDLQTIVRASRRPNTKLMTFGGTYQPNAKAFKCTFPAMHSYIDACNITKAFLSASGVSDAGQLTVSENFAREIGSLVLHKYPTVYLLADNSKFGKAALLNYGSLADLRSCISDTSLQEPYRALCHSMGTELILAEP